MAAAKKARALAATTHLIPLFLHAQGESEVPPQFFLWSLLSVMAAAVADRVWIKKFRSENLTPNLYTMLLGPSGCGKGQAIDAAVPLVKTLPRCRTFEGPITAQGLEKFLHQIKKKEAGGRQLGSKVFLVHEELAMCIGEGKQASDFVKAMTGLWKSRVGVIEKQTVTSGHYAMENPNLNWLCGTTKEWLIESIPLSALKAGFGRRIIGIEGERNRDIRIPEPIFPEDYDEVMDHLRQRFELLSHMEGEFEKSIGAQAMEYEWYMQRPPPADEDAYPAWDQAHDLSLKLAMLIALAEGGDRLYLRELHMRKGQELAAEAQASVPHLLAWAAITPETEGMERIQSLFIRRKIWPRSDLLRESHMTRNRFNECVQTLMQMHRIDMKRVPLLDKEGKMKETMVFIEHTPGKLA